MRPQLDCRVTGRAGQPLSTGGHTRSIDPVEGQQGGRGTRAGLSLGAGHCVFLAILGSQGSPTLFIYLIHMWALLHKIKVLFQHWAWEGELRTISTDVTETGHPG